VTVYPNAHPPVHKLQFAIVLLGDPCIAQQVPIDSAVVQYSSKILLEQVRILSQSRHCSGPCGVPD